MSRRATAREWMGLGVIAIPCMLYSMDLTVLNLASPHVSADLRPSATELLWIVDVYGFLVAGSLVTMGTLGDRIGRRKLLLIGAVAFGLASTFAAFSSTAAMLIAARGLLGLAAATLAPSTLSLIRSMFEDAEERRTAIGVWVASFSIGAAIGPLVGGLLLTHFWWGSVFLINVPLMLLLLVLGPLLLPEHRDPDAGRLDVVSAAMSIGAVLLLIFGLKRSVETGELLAMAAPSVAGLALGWLFLRRQKRLAHPFIDLALFRSPAFSAALCLSMIAFFVNFGIFLLLAQYLQLGLGLSPFLAGVWTVPSALGFVAGSIVLPRLAAHVAPARVVAAGFALAAVGLAILTQIGPDDGLAVIVAGGVILAFGLAPVVILSTDLIVGAAPVERAGSAAALSETSTELGGALGIALLGSIVAACYRSGTAQLASSAVPPEAATAARETLGAAAVVAQSLPQELGAPLLETSRAAFAVGVRASAGLGSLLAAGAAIAALVLLRARNPGAEAAPERA